MASIRDIAKRAGVSIATVSRALNNDPVVTPRTREKVLAVVNGEGYVAPMGRRVTTNIGYAHVGRQASIYDSALLNGVYDSALVAGVLRGLDESRLNVVMLNVNRDKATSETYTQFFVRMGVRGVLLRTTAQSRHICQTIADEGFPAVVISERFDSPNVSFIDCDSRADSVRAVEYLIGLGHRRIAFAMNAVPDCDHLDRFEGYKQAMEKAGLGVDDGLVFRQRASLSGGATIIEMLMRRSEPPTAVYFGDQVLAVGGVNKAHRLGVRIPDDLSVVGVDDSEMRFSVHPTMTAVCQDAVQLGMEAALGLSRLLKGTTKGCFRKTLPSYFEVNESTGPPPLRAGGAVVATGTDRAAGDDLRAEAAAPVRGLPTSNDSGNGQEPVES